MVENRNQEDPKLFSLPEWPELYTLEFLLRYIHYSKIIEKCLLFSLTIDYLIICVHKNHHIIGQNSFINAMAK